jgi:hypothetical protein
MTQRKIKRKYRVYTYIYIVNAIEMVLFKKIININIYIVNAIEIMLFKEIIDIMTIRIYIYM